MAKWGSAERIRLWMLCAVSAPLFKRLMDKASVELSVDCIQCTLFPNLWA